MSLPPNGTIYDLIRLYPIERNGLYLSFLKESLVLFVKVKGALNLSVQCPLRAFLAEVVVIKEGMNYYTTKKRPWLYKAITKKLPFNTLFLNLCELYSTQVTKNQ